MAQSEGSKPQRRRGPLERLTGEVERIAFTNIENGFTIAKVRVQGHLEAVTVVGTLLDPAPGTVLEMTGEWTRHRKFGDQFKVDSFVSKTPVTETGIQQYLGSGLVKGIGTVMSERIVSRFGTDTLRIIDETPERLREIEGIGATRTETISAAWQGQRSIRDIMLFLHDLGVGSSFAARVYKQYGKHAIQVIRENPYRLATDMHGIGFLTADRVAAKSGVEMDSDMRVQAGLLHALDQSLNEGHVYLPRSILVERAIDLLNVPRGIVEKAVDVVAHGDRCTIEEFPEEEPAVYLRNQHYFETGAASRLRNMASGSTGTALRAFAMDDSKVEAALRRVEQRSHITLADQQRQAVLSALEHPVLVITGGPGTGKTTIITCILDLFEGLGLASLLAAPTGRAAKRMEEATNRPAKTIHRLLGVDLQRGGFRSDEESPLDCDLLVVDEVSMVDSMLMFSLLRAIPGRSSLILVGDAHQLPSVGPGNVLRDVIASGAVPTVRLDQIFRQALESRIVTNAHRINSGELPVFDTDSAASTDFYFIRQADPERVLATVKELVASRIPGRFGFDSFGDIQVLTPMNRGLVGTINLNRELQSLLNPREDGVVRGDKRISEGDKVMQTRNNYDKNVYNGDIGLVSRIDPEEKTLCVAFEGRDVAYEYSELDEMVLAYATSVHKSQGSEYPAVVMPILTQHYMLLQRNLLYTAVTRARDLLVLVGSEKALSIAVKNDKTSIRYTRLAKRLAGM